MNSRERYVKPEFHIHGSVSSLTLSTPGSDVKMMMMMRMMMMNNMMAM